MTAAMNAGTEYADGDPFQQAKYSYMHEMTNRDTRQPASEADKLANDFVAIYWQKGQAALAAGDTYTAFKDLGIAIHPLQDATSPAHSGWQPWSDHPGTEAEIRHVLKEIKYPGPHSNLQMVTNQYIEMFVNGRFLPANTDLFSGIKADPQSYSDKAIDGFINGLSSYQYIY